MLPKVTQIGSLEEPLVVFLFPSIFAFYIDFYTLFAIWLDNSPAGGGRGQVTQGSTDSVIFLNPGGLLPSTLVYLSRAGNIRVPAGSCFCTRLVAAADRAFGAQRQSVGRGGASRRLRRRAALRAAMGRLRRPSHDWI